MNPHPRSGPYREWYRRTLGYEVRMLRIRARKLGAEVESDVLETVGAMRAKSTDALRRAWNQDAHA